LADVERDIAVVAVAPNLLRDAELNLQSGASRHLPVHALAVSASAVVPPSVQRAFGLTGHQVALPWGMGTSIRIADAVLKPVDDVIEAVWVAETLSRLPEEGFRIARPLRAHDGSWIAAGWSAATFVPGESAPAGRWHELLAAGRAFHAAVRHERRPEFLQRRHHRWAVADRVAWGEASADPVPELEPVLDKLAPVVQAPTRGEVPQVVHGDLAGNVLFAPGLPPAIIDFSPYWRPTTYAAAIVAVDGLLWFGADTTLLRQVADEAGSTMPLVRAIIFRLIALNERSRFDRSALDELPLFLNAASAIERLHVS
jgi:uncharacterized protein (TIGR02569 family)